MKKKTCKHKWVFDKELPFYERLPFGSQLLSHYRTVYHCEKCMQQDIQTIYR